MASQPLVERAMKHCPASVSLVGPADAELALSRYTRMTEMRAAPFESGHLRGPNFTFDWPLPPLKIRLIPGGVELLQDEVGFDVESLIDDAISHMNLGNEFFFWGLGFHKHGVFRGPYQKDVRCWVKRDLIFSPMVFLHGEGEYMILNYDQFHFSVFASSEDNVKEIDYSFGGRQRLESLFVDWIDNDHIVSGSEGRTWARRYLLSWMNSQR